VIFPEPCRNFGVPTVQALSPVGRCKSLDSSADGYGRGEGFVAGIMQRHNPNSQHSIVARVVACAVNQAGRSSSLTAPHGPAQTELMTTAMAAGNLDPNQVRLLSMHGTGTALGDPIEIGAVGQAWRAALGETFGARRLSLISSKSCFGHTEGAAGLTGLVAAAGAAHHQSSPAIMHLRTVNPYVESALSGWGDSSRLAAHIPRQTAPHMSANVSGTSSFGMSGVNAHAMLLPGDQKTLHHAKVGSAGQGDMVVESYILTLASMVPVVAGAPLCERGILVFKPSTPVSARGRSTLRHIHHFHVKYLHCQPILFEPPPG
jgi:acyl transferase domain-containing protein